jgi:hypothetical protein
VFPAIRHHAGRRSKRRSSLPSRHPACLDLRAAPATVVGFGGACGSRGVFICGIASESRSREPEPGGAETSLSHGASPRALGVTSLYWGPFESASAESGTNAETSKAKAEIIGIRAVENQRDELSTGGAFRSRVCSLQPVRPEMFRALRRPFQIRQLFTEGVEKCSFGLGAAAIRLAPAYGPIGGWVSWKIFV